MTPTPKELPALPQPVAWRKEHTFGGKVVEHTFTCQRHHVEEWAKEGIALDPVFTTEQLQAYALKAVAASLQGIERDAARWISADECRPPRNRRVLCYFPAESTAVMDGIWTGFRFIVNGYDRTDVVTHWCELPTPPDAAMKDAQ